MRSINWDEELSAEDVAWLRTTGILGIEERIARHQAQFNAEVPEEEEVSDDLTKSALDPTARTTERVGEGGAVEVVVTPPAEDDEGDDYDSWKVSELNAEVSARNAIEGATEVIVEATGKGGVVVKADLIKGLRLWDQENPDALKD